MLIENLLDRRARYGHITELQVIGKEMAPSDWVLHSGARSRSTDFLTVLNGFDLGIGGRYTIHRCPRVWKRGSFS